MKPLKIIKEFDSFLATRGVPFEAICIGGTALALLGLITRETQDCDVLVPEISDEIKQLSEEFAKQMMEVGMELKESWFNNGPASLIRDLPEGWRERTQLVFEGEVLRLQTLGRQELLMSKLFALCDRAIDRPDCIALAPSQSELQITLSWLEARDGNPMWPEHVREIIADLAKELGYEL